MLGPVINALEKGDFKVQKETVWVITNYTSGGSVEQIVQLINAGVMAPLCRMLTTQDSKTTMVALDAVNNILLVSLPIPFFYKKKHFSIHFLPFKSSNVFCIDFPTLEQKYYI